MREDEPEVKFGTSYRLKVTHHLFLFFPLVPYEDGKGVIKRRKVRMTIDAPNKLMAKRMLKALGYDGRIVHLASRIDPDSTYFGDVP